MKKKVTFFIVAFIMSLGLSLAGDAYASCYTCLQGTNNGKCLNSNCATNNQSGSACCGNICYGCSVR
jgi:hypothetical protein